MCLRSYITSPEKCSSKSSEEFFFHLGMDCITIGLISSSQKIQIIIKNALPESMDCLTFLILKMVIVILNEKKNTPLSIKESCYSIDHCRIHMKKKSNTSPFLILRKMSCVFESDHLVSLGIPSTHLNRRTIISKKLIVDIERVAKRLTIQLTGI